MIDWGNFIFDKNFCLDSIPNLNQKEILNLKNFLANDYNIDFLYITNDISQFWDVCLDALEQFLVFFWSFTIYYNLHFVFSFFWLQVFFFLML